MLFSTVLSSIELSRKAPRINGQQKTCIITMQDIQHDFDAMKVFHNKIFPNATTKLQREFSKEVREFYDVIENKYANDNNLNPEDDAILGQIYIETKRLKEQLSFLLLNTSENDFA